MTRLEKYLTTTANNIIHAETTESRYFIIDHLAVRLSDHYSVESDADMQIIIPFNGGTNYTVFFSENTKALCWNAKKIAEFIPYYSLIKSMKTRNVLKRSSEKLNTVQKLEVLNSESNTSELRFYSIMTPVLQKNYNKKQKDIFTRSKSVWTIAEIQHLHTMFHQEFKVGTGVNEDFQIFLTCTACNYKEVFNIYKLVVVDNKREPDIRLLQEAYQIIKDNVK